MGSRRFGAVGAFSHPSCTGHASHVAAPSSNLGAELVTLSARTRCTQPGRWWQRVGVDQVRAPRRGEACPRSHSALEALVSHGRARTTFQGRQRGGAPDRHTPPTRATRPDWIGAELGVPAQTVSPVLARNGVPRLCTLDPSPLRCSMLERHRGPLRTRGARRGAVPIHRWPD